MTAPVRRINTPEPAALVGVIEAALAFVVAGHWLHLDSNQVGLVMAGITAVGGFVVAWRTHQTTLGVVVGLANAVFALGIGFGLHLAPELTAAAIGLISVLFNYFNRSQATPKGVPALARDDALAA